MYNVLKENDEPRKEVNLDTWHKAGYDGLGVNVLVCDFNGKIYDYMKDYAVLIDPEGITKNEGDHNTHVAQVNHEASPRATIYVAPWTHSSKEIIQWLRENPDLIDIAGASLTSPPTDIYNIFKELNIPFTVSSGNDHDKGKNGVNFPASIYEFIAVGAYNWRDKGVCRNDVLGYSNGGEDLECLGLTNIYVQNEDRTNTFAYTGTSTARPFLTGMLACYIQWRKEHGLPKLTQKDARDFVIANCVDLHEEGFDYSTGFGLFTMPRLEELEKTLPKPKEPNPPIEAKPIPEKPKEDIKKPEIIIEEPYYVKQQLIKYNNPNETFRNLKGIVIHSTANIGVSAQNHFNYWNNADRQSSVHYILDWNSDCILQLILEDRIAWHTGNYQGNREWLGIEMCETADKNQFNIVWNKTVWFVADMCIRRNWNVDDNVWSHNGLRSLYKGINHTDPYGYLQRMGKSWQQLCDAISVEIKRRKSQSYTPSRSTSEKGGEDMLDIAILLYSKEDYWSGTDVSDKNGNCAIFIRPADKSVPKDAMNSKKLFVIGGETVKHPNEILLSGSNKYRTAQAVYSYLQGK